MHILIPRRRGGYAPDPVRRQPRRRSSDLAIAATANVHGATLLTHNLKDFDIIADLVRVQAP